MFESLSNFSYCNINQMGCTIDLPNNSLDYLLDEKLKCLSKCPLECNSIEYKVSTSRANYPTPFLRDILSRYPVVQASGMTKEEIDKAVLRINVYYESMTYTTTTETEATTAIVLFSNIGGTLSLCLGISILSLIKIIGILLSMSMNNKSNNKVNNW